MERKPQSLSNHVKFDPPFHFVLMPSLLLTFILCVVNVVRHYETLTAWILLLLGFVAIMTAFKARVYALKVQDRLIRMEERQRLEKLLPSSMRSRIDDLTESQLVALRFASDAECPNLVEKVIGGKLKNAEIKKAILVWRPDYFRV